MLTTLAALATDDTEKYTTGLPHTEAGGNQLHDILAIAFGILGALAVIFMLIGAMRFITAQGNPQEIAKARSTIIYAAVGVIVAALAEAIVAFALGRL
jgi:uncharacterized membrane protein